jgi:hypothetical protein
MEGGLQPAFTCFSDDHPSRWKLVPNFPVSFFIPSKNLRLEYGVNYRVIKVYRLYEKKLLLLRVEAIE